MIDLTKDIFSIEAHRIKEEIRTSKSKSKELVYQAFKQPGLFRSLINKHGAETLAYFIADVSCERNIASFKNYMLAALHAHERLNEEVIGNRTG